MSRRFTLEELEWVERGRMRYGVGGRGRSKGIHAVDLSNYSAEEIANAVGWKHDPDDLVKALIASEFLTDDMILIGGDILVGHLEGVDFLPQSERARRMKAAPRQVVYARDKYRCVYCGSENDLSLDHVIPYSRGGTEAVDNLVTCCRSCNSRKSDRTPEEAGMPLIETDEGGEDDGP